MHILVVEDQQRLANLLKRVLSEERHAVDVAYNGTDGYDLAASDTYDLVILDVMLPHKDGHAVCRELRRRGRLSPILMLTARGAVDDRVAGLDAGADDYLTKPFDFKELLARVRALLRRSTALRPATLRVADLKLDTASHAVERAGRVVTLTAKEYALLEFLLLNQGRVVGREEIAQHVWDENFDPFSNVIDVYIKRLRSKMDTEPRRRLIHTRRGEGYLLAAEQGAGDA